MSEQLSQMSSVNINGQREEVMPYVVSDSMHNICSKRKEKLRRFSSNIQHSHHYVCSHSSQESLQCDILQKIICLELSFIYFLSNFFYTGVILLKGMPNMVTSTPVLIEEKTQKLKYPKWTGLASSILDLKVVEVPGSSRGVHILGGCDWAWGNKGFHWWLP